MFGCSEKSWTSSWCVPQSPRYWGLGKCWWAWLASKWRCPLGKLKDHERLQDQLWRSNLVDHRGRQIFYVHFASQLLLIRHLLWKRQPITWKEYTLSDPTEQLRKQRVAEINSKENTRQSLEEKHGQVWSTEEMQQEFDAIGFLAPLIVVSRKSDGVKGSLEFSHNPRYYFNWQVD